jgi:hypothetical protein
VGSQIIDHDDIVSLYNSIGTRHCSMQHHNPYRFAELMNQLLDGHPFAEAFERSLGCSVADAWKEFTASGVRVAASSVAINLTKAVATPCTPIIAQPSLSLTFPKRAGAAG